MRINVLGMGHTYNLAEMIRDLHPHWTVHVNVNNNSEPYDANIIMGIWHIPESPPENRVLFLMGSDVNEHWIKQCLKEILEMKLILYIDDEQYKRFWEIMDNLNECDCAVPLKRWCMPYNVKMFNSDSEVGWEATRDIYYYAGGDPTTYKLPYILDQVKNMPKTKCTLRCQILTRFDSTVEYLPNLMLLGSQPWSFMPQIYRMHTLFKTYLNREQSIAPVSVWEALACGLKADYNDKAVTTIPDYVRSDVAIPVLIKMLEKL